jgi:penicillin amidase
VTRAEIRRDRWGVPHLVADDADTLSYAQGFATARDRSWQLDAERRRSEGTLAAVAGPGALEWDVLARRAELDRLARSAYRALDHPTRRWLRAYVRGVNCGFAEPAASLTVEHAATASRPEPWSPWTPLGVLAVRHLLFGSFPHKLWRAHVVAALGEGALDVLTTEVEAHAGSNAWAVPGHLTASGAPLLAGDPHRVVEAPGVYQQVRLTCPEFDVVGLAFPGVPGVQHVGHTGGVAWGVTNAMADDQDLTAEALRRDLAGGVLVRESGGWVPTTARVEMVRVRGAADVAVEVVRTARGPVVLGGLGPDDGEATGLALRTPARVLGDLGLSAVPLLLRARTVADVEVALARWVEPVNSVLVADTAGRVRRLVAGRVPLRDDVNRRGAVPATDPRHAWTGWADLPGADAAGEVLVAANDRRPGDTAELGSRFAAPHRARRIRVRLEGRTRLAVADCQELQTDTLLGTVPALRRLLRRVAPAALSGPGARLRAQILGWDGRMAAGSVAADAFATWRDALVQAVAADPALAPLHGPLGHPALLRPWLDVAGRVATSLEAIAARADRLEIDVVAAAAAALEAAGHRPPGRTWGDRHVLRAQHALAGTSGEPALPTPALDGDGDCVLATSSVPGVAAWCGRGPVARYVWDLGGAARGRWVVPLGASGRWDSPHALDQLPAWLAGNLVPVPGEGEPTRLEEELDVDLREPGEVR